jgi:hypothetical protein
MSRLAIFLYSFSLLAIGCSSTRQEPPPPMAPPPGWGGAPMVAPAPSGCSSCGAANPVINAPRYSPPIPSAPPMTYATPGLSLGSPVSPPPVVGPLQVAFKPYVPPLEASLGTIQLEESPTIPVPPTDNPATESDGRTTSRTN